MLSKNTICLWFDGTALEAAQFYAQTFPDSQLGAVHRAPSDYPSGKQGDILTVEFTVAGIPCVGLNGGPAASKSRLCEALKLVPVPARCSSPASTETSHVRTCEPLRRHPL